MRIFADVVVDLQYGDCGKGKVSHHLASANEYTHVLRYNGGCNAGHTIFHKGKKFVTHHIPAGVFFGIRSVIGPGCVVDADRFLAEIKGLEAGGIKTKGKVFIARNTHAGGFRWPSRTTTIATLLPASMGGRGERFDLAA